jgi:hypothetical protein
VGRLAVSRVPPFRRTEDGPVSPVLQNVGQFLQVRGQILRGEMIFGEA